MQDAKNAESPMISIIEASRTSENRRGAVFFVGNGEQRQKPGRIGRNFTTPGRIAIIKPQGKNRIRGTFGRKQQVSWRLVEI